MMNNKVAISRWDIAEFLKTQEDIDEYLNVAFESGDYKQIAKALGNVARVRGMTELSDKTGLAREHLYSGLSENGNPTLLTLTAVIDCLGYRLSITSK